MPVLVTSLLCYTYKQYNEKLKPMKIIRLISLKALPFIILAVIFGWCFVATSCEAEADDNDEYIVATNVFTIKGEGDFFEVTTADGKGVVALKIYTRAGVMIFSMEARRCIWDGCSIEGQPMATGVYHYTAEVRGTKIKKSSFVYLYR